MAWTRAHQRAFKAAEAVSPVTREGQERLAARERQEAIQARRRAVAARLRAAEGRARCTAVRERVFEAGRQRRAQERQQRDPWGWAALFRRDN